MTVRSRAGRILAFAATVIWLALVVYTTAHHEFWRDEVRALSIARAARTPFDLVALTKNEGHPLLWYVLLYLGSCVTTSSLVLPVVSITVALASVVLLLFWSPLPLWLGVLFVAGIPAFEYSVEARNYGISMLLMFATAILYRMRRTRPMLLAVALALLANTNAHSTILAGLFAAVWMGEALVERDRAARPGFAALLVVAGGLALAAVVAFPHSDSITRSWMAFDPDRLASIAGETLINPGATFSMLLPAVAVPTAALSVALWVAVLGLSLRPVFLVAATSAMVALGLFFQTVYRGGLRHQALLLVFFLALYWMLIDERPRLRQGRVRRWLFAAGLYVAIPLILTGQFWTAGLLRRVDLHGEASSGKAFGAFLESSDRYRDAVLVPEPDYVLESLPYYADNPIWLAREHRYGKTASFTSASDPSLTLGQLLAEAHRLKVESQRPVLVVLAHPELRTHAHSVTFSYGKVFSWSEDDVRKMGETLSFVASFQKSYGDENYNVYEVR